MISYDMEDKKDIWCKLSLFCAVYVDECHHNYIPSVGVKEGLGWVFSAPQWRGKSRNLALP